MYLFINLFNDNTQINHILLAFSVYLVLFFLNANHLIHH